MDRKTRAFLCKKGRAEGICNDYTAMGCLLEFYRMEKLACALLEERIEKNAYVHIDDIDEARWLIAAFSALPLADRTLRQWKTFFHIYALYEQHMRSAMKKNLVKNKKYVA